MELWMQLLFGNPVGLLSIIVVVVTIGIVAYFATFLYRKSHGKG